MTVKNKGKKGQISRRVVPNGHSGQPVKPPTPARRAAGVSRPPAKASTLPARRLPAKETKSARPAAKPAAPVAKQPRRRRPRRAYKKDPDCEYLTQSEMDAVFSVIEREGSVRDRAIYRTMYHRGLRASEVGLLKLSDWNEKDGLLYVRRVKNSLSRTYRLLPLEARSLRAWLKIRGNMPGPLFPSRQARAGGLGMTRGRVFQLFRKYCGLANIRIEKSHVHAVRHTTGTRLSELGETAETIQDILGHSSPQSTAIYMHYSQKRRDEAWERLKNWR